MKNKLQDITMAALAFLPVTTICFGFLVSLYSYNETVFTFLGGAVVGFATSQSSRYSRLVGGTAIDEDTTKAPADPKAA